MGEGDIVGLDNSGFIGDNEPYMIELLEVAYRILEDHRRRLCGVVVIVKTIGTRALSVACRT